VDKQEASRQLAEKCEQMQKLFYECVQIAVEAQIAFELPWGGEGQSALNGYGAGATFYPAGVEDWNKNYDGHEWVSSSQTC
jgi:hypothetical protein